MVIGLSLIGLLLILLSTVDRNSVPINCGSCIASWRWYLKGLPFRRVFCILILWNGSLVFLSVNLLKMADFKWTAEKKEDLISMYECRPWLCNVKLEEYSNRDKREKGMEEIAKHFGLGGKFLTVPTQVAPNSCYVYTHSNFQATLVDFNKVA